MKVERILAVSVVFTMFSIPVLWAQESQPQPQPTQDNFSGAAPQQPLAPITADGGDTGHALPAAAAKGLFVANPSDQDTPQADPDTHLLSSGETFGIGSLYTRRHLFDPALDFSEVGETNLVAGQIVPVSSLGGTLNLDQISGRNHLTIVYRGGETVYSPSNVKSRSLPYQLGSVSDEILLGRWTLRLRDDVFYSLESPFGGLLTGGFGLAGQPGLPNGVPMSAVPGSTILTGLTRQMSDLAIGELDYGISRRTTLTFLGSYDLTNFLDVTFFDTRQANGSVGLNYALDAKNSIGWIYSYEHLNLYPLNLTQSNSVQFAYGRKILGRLAFQAAAGPEFFYFQNVGLPDSQQVSWMASSALTYQRRRTLYSFAYYRGAHAGSGVFSSAENQTITAGVSHRFTRFWMGSLNGGYAINRPLISRAGFINRFDTWYSQASLTRQLGRELRFGLSYEFLRQTNSVGICPVQDCGLPGGQASLFGATVEWHPLSSIQPQ